MPNKPDDVRKLLYTALHLAEVANDWNLDEIEIDEQPVRTWTLIKEFRDALDSLPAAPEPDWSLFDDEYDDDGVYCGPDCYIMEPYGNQAYYFRADEVEWHGAFPSLDDVMDSAIEWRIGWIVDLSKYNVGIDWRTTLRKRPEAQHAEQT